jgi:hypothetical protein
MAFVPKFLATGIGSLPFEDAARAVDIVLSAVPEAPFWPQLPRRGLTEHMEAQYTEGMPCIVLDTEKQRVYFDTSGDYSEAFAQFYEAYLAAAEAPPSEADWSFAAISPQYAQGIDAFEARLRAEGKKRPFVKVQSVGPCSFALTAVDHTQRAAYYNEELRDLIVKAISSKCRWQIERFRPFAQQVICFIDEPILSAFGSSTYISVKRDEVIALIREVADSVHAAGALSAVHCCGNTEWSILVEAGVDIVNFDSFSFGDTIAMYPEAMRALFDRGGALAWGAVPTSVAVREQNVASLVNRLENSMDKLAAAGIDKRLITERALVTPACGTGSLETADALKVFELLGALSPVLREKYQL